MPTYDYECTSCGKRFDLFQSITERPKKKCIHCSKLTAKRLIGSGAAIIFKGSGFYQTDYRSANYKKRAKEEAKANGGGGSDADKTSDKKQDKPKEN